MHALLSRIDPNGILHRGKTLRERILKIYLSAGFYPSTFLTSVFHEGLSFMAVGHNRMCISMLALAAGGSRGCDKAPLWSSGAKSLEALTISAIPGFQIAFPCII